MFLYSSVGSRYESPPRSPHHGTATARDPAMNGLCTTTFVQDVPKSNPTTRSAHAAPDG